VLGPARRIRRLCAFGGFALALASRFRRLRAFGGFALSAAARAVPVAAARQHHWSQPSQPRAVSAAGQPALWHIQPVATGGGTSSRLFRNEGQANPALLLHLPPRHHVTRPGPAKQRHRCHNDAHQTTSLPQRRRYRHQPAPRHQPTPRYQPAPRHRHTPSGGATPAAHQAGRKPRPKCDESGGAGEADLLERLTFTWPAL
jgi:hypothetical protein